MNNSYFKVVKNGELYNILIQYINNELYRECLKIPLKGFHFLNVFQLKDDIYFYSLYNEDVLNNEYIQNNLTLSNYEEVALLILTEYHDLVSENNKSLIKPPIKIINTINWKELYHNNNLLKAKMLIKQFNDIPLNISNNIFSFRLDVLTSKNKEVFIKKIKINSESYRYAIYCGDKILSKKSNLFSYNHISNSEKDIKYIDSFLFKGFQEAVIFYFSNKYINV